MIAGLPAVRGHRDSGRGLPAGRTGRMVPRGGEVSMNRLRVGLVCGHFDPARDGVADYTRHLAQHLRSVGCEALICTAHRYARTRGAEVVGVTDRWDVPGVLRAAHVLGRLPLDV